MRDAIKTKNAIGNAPSPALAKRLQKIEFWPMLTFKTANLRISMWFLVPVEQPPRSSARAPVMS